MKNNQYKCAVCKEVFDKGLTDAEAEKQLDKEFPGFITEECDLVCDDCFKKIGGHINQQKTLQELHKELVDKISKGVAEYVDEEIIKKLK